MIDPIKHGEFHFDPRRRQQGPLTSTAVDPDAKASFQEALRKAADKVNGAKPAENSEKPSGDRILPPGVR